MSTSQYIIQYEFSFRTKDQDLITLIFQQLAQFNVNVSFIMMMKVASDYIVKIIPGLPQLPTDDYSRKITRQTLTSYDVSFDENKVLALDPTLFNKNLPPAGQSRPGVLENLMEIISPHSTIFTLGVNEGGWLIVGVDHIKKAIAILGLS